MSDTITQLKIISAAFDAFSSIASFIGSASVLAAFTPKPKQSGKLSWLHRWLNKLAFNFGFAANKEDG